jgi:hypothetical protein
MAYSRWSQGCVTLNQHVCNGYYMYGKCMVYPWGVNDRPRPTDQPARFGPFSVMVS